MNTRFFLSQLCLRQAGHITGTHRQLGEYLYPYGQLVQIDQLLSYFILQPQRFRALCSRENLLASFGDNVVRLSTANTYSYRKGELITLFEACLFASSPKAGLTCLDWPLSCSGPALSGICGAAAASPGSHIPRQW